MKNLLFFFLLIISSVVSGQTYKVTESDLQRALNLNQGNLLFSNTVFSTNDTIIRKASGAVYSRLAKFQRSILYLKKVNNVFVGKIYKDSTINIDLVKTDTGYVFVTKPNSPATQDLKLPTAEEIAANTKTISKQEFDYYAEYGEASTVSDLQLVQSGWYCIFLDMDGAYVDGTGWNYAGPIICAPMQYVNSVDTLNYMLGRLKEQFYPFKIVATRDSVVYNAALANRRSRIISTPTSAWYGQSAGVSFIGSGYWGDNTPGFVFWPVLNLPAFQFQYHVDCPPHEAGHSWGLYHQAAYNTSCVKTSDYNPGYGSGETGFAPIMGQPYYKNLSLWWNGPNPYGCNSLQDDMAIMATGGQYTSPSITYMGYRQPEFAQTPKSARSLSKGGSLYQGLLINDSNYVKIHVTSTDPTTITAAPINPGFGTAANFFVKPGLRLYTLEGTLIAQSSSPTSLTATITQSLTPGFYYVVVFREGVPFNTSGYSMYGHYRISQN
jgi:hypothetical protein